MIDFKLQASGIPDSIEQYQLALDAAFNAGKAIAAGAAPVPNGYRLVSVEALTRWRNAFAEELSAWNIDPPLHHMQTSHDEISAILAAAGEPK